MPALEIPGGIQRRIDRGYKHMRRDANKRRLCVRFERGDTFTYLDDKGAMQALALATSPRGDRQTPPPATQPLQLHPADHRGQGKRRDAAGPVLRDRPLHRRPRGRRGRVTRATRRDLRVRAVEDPRRHHQRRQDRDRRSAASPTRSPTSNRTSARTSQTVDGDVVGTGDIRIKVFGGNEAFCEPGTDWDVSPWWCTIQALGARPDPRVPRLLRRPARPRRRQLGHPQRPRPR